MLERDPQLFGSRNRTRVLVAICLLKETFPSELAATLQLRLFSVQSILASLEQEGVAVSRLMGRTRLVSISPRYFARKELELLLRKLGMKDVGLQKQLASPPRRPRRADKAAVM